MLTGQNHLKDSSKYKHRCCWSNHLHVSNVSEGTSSLTVRGQCLRFDGFGGPPWSTVRWSCTWSWAASCPASAAGSWCAPLFPQSTGPSLRWAASCSPPPTTTPTCGGTASPTPPGCPTAKTTRLCWLCRVRLPWSFCSVRDVYSNLYICLLSVYFISFRKVWHWFVFILFLL